MGPAKIDIEKLRASDFPGLDEAKFKEWQELQIRLMRRVKIVWNYAFPVLLVLYPIVKGKTISHGFFELDWTGMYFFLVLLFGLGNAI